MNTENKKSRILHQQKMLQMVEDCLNSGMSKKDWCRENNIPQNSFYYWQRVRNEKNSHQGDAFVALKMTAQTEAPICISYPNGVEIKVSPQSSLQLIQTLIRLA